MKRKTKSFDVFFIISISICAFLVCTYALSPCFKYFEVTVDVILFPNDLYIIGAKPIQTIWDAKALVKSKLSVICVTVRSTFEERKFVEIEVTYDFGTKKVIDKGPEGFGVPIDPGINTVFIPGGPVLDENGNIIQQPWTAPFLWWASTGTDDTIKIRLDPGNKIEEAEERNNEYLLKPIKVVDTREFRVLFIPACYEGEQPPQASYVEGNSSKSAEFLRATYPLAENEVTIGVRFSPYVHKRKFPIDAAWAHKLDMILMCKNIARLAKISEYDRGVGMVPADWFIDKGFYWYGVTPRTRTDGCLADHLHWTVVSHEIGHTCGLWLDKEEGDVCPHPWGWGYETSGFWVAQRTIIPRQNEQSAYCFMGYQTSYEAQKFYIDHPINRSGRWICSHCYNKLLDYFKIGDDPSLILLSGLIFRNGTIVLDPIYTLSRGTPDLQEGSTGNYKVTLLDTDGRIIKEFGFNVSFVDYFDPDVELNLTSFLFTLPFFDGVKEVQIRNASDYVLIRRVISDYVPQVNLISPNGGEIIRKGSLVTISWNATDPDGDKLYYTILFSNDLGETWIPIVTDWSKNTYSWDTSNLKDSSDYLIRVIATDGFNTNYDESDSSFSIFTTDIAVTNITISKRFPVANETIDVYVTLENRGNTTETFTLFLNYTRLIDPVLREKLLTLNPGEITILNLTWTPNLAGRYKILAYTSEIPEDIDPSNNRREITIYVRSQASTGGASSMGFRRCLLK